MKIFDTHVHFDYYPKEEQSIILEECLKKDIDFLHLAIKEEAFEFLLTYTKHYALGIHPIYAEEASTNYKKSLEEFLPKALALGEIGLDGYRNPVTKKQEIIFQEQLEIALTYKKPVLIHTRNASKKTIEILKKFSGKFVIHSFTGEKDMLYFCLDQDAYVGINGMVTFPKNTELQDSLKLIPKNRVLVETDSPFLSPIRGQTNYPYYITMIMNKINTLYELEMEELILENTKIFLGDLY